MWITGLTIILTAAVATAAAQSPSLPAFDALSVKRNTSTGMGMMADPRLRGQFRIRNVPLHAILLQAFGAREHELFGIPAWTRDERFDIVGTYPAEGVKGRDGYRGMLEKALVERFGLKTHRETREMPVYRLVMARADKRRGPRLVPSNVDCQQWLAENKPQVGAGSPSPLTRGGRRTACENVPMRRAVIGGTQPLSVLARSLENITGRFVVDDTGLAGNFDYDLEFARTIEAGSGPVPADGGTSIFTALQEQLGLKLEPVRRPMPVVVIDAVSRPTPD